MVTQGQRILIFFAHVQFLLSQSAGTFANQQGKLLVKRVKKSTGAKLSWSATQMNAAKSLKHNTNFACARGMRGCAQ
jgi:hypothetical protein